MQNLSDKEFITTEKIWANVFKIQFVKSNNNGSEWWKVWYKKRYVSCSSMLMACKIANTAWERLNNLNLSIDHTNVLRKVSSLLNISVEKIKYKCWYNGSWHETKKKVKQMHFKNTFENRKYKCPKCGVFEIEFEQNEKELVTCIRCGNIVSRVY